MGGWLVIDQAVSIGQFVAIEIVFLTILVNLEKLISGVDSIFDILTALAKLDNTFQHEGVDISPFNPKDSQPVEGSAWLQNFSETHPPSDRRAPWRWMAFLAFTLFASLFLPWTQTVSMVGTVTMDNPMERPAALYAAENGRLSTWFVREGQVVRADKMGVAAADQVCQNCRFYVTTDASAAWAPCQLFQNRLVAGPGWCAGWVPKS